MPKLDYEDWIVVQFLVRTKRFFRTDFGIRTSYDLASAESYARSIFGLQWNEIFVDRLMICVEKVIEIDAEGSENE